MIALPLQVIDNFLLQYNVGQVLVLLLVLGFFGTLPLRNKTITGIHVVTFGLILAITPISLMGNDVIYKILGVGLLFVGPMVMIAGD